MNDFFKELNINFDSNTKPQEYSPLVLAYIGDSVFDMLVRTMIIKEGNCPVNVLHKKARGFVNAAAQAKMFEKIIEVADEEEMAVLKRGRNAKSFTKAKNASVTDYRHATGLEALFGYLYLSGKNERILELFKLCIEKEN